jgi:NTP pyrophosphatase (non-canonical NTP hydrolase)
MEELQKLMDEIREWSDATFGERQRTIPILHHLIKEVPEAIEACKNPKNDNGVYELADCFMLLLDACNHYDVDAAMLITYTYNKLSVNRKRKWGMPDENGVIEHIQE